ncbi:MAG: tRNA uridine-5-carboxymethylaminomethyl(34) synthesis GTPase MnmE [Candidatus Marinimicrobia bacterium]|nr:tRNA uridine-5-carboxymethylaminomethyl(34) synthesis GTPase MnmE [Candidatus Neomarinimicrobiota bacterium]
MLNIDHYDTIAAISTPQGVGGIAVIRISGDRALDIALRGITLKTLAVRYAHFTQVQDPETKEIIDDVVVTFFKSPASYTGDDTVEISCHGGYAAAPSILNLYYKLGARPALPGEFTRRAFMNGKMDLLQAEAVADLIHAVSESGKKLATRTLSGKLSQEVIELRAELTDIASILELELDFSEQEITTLEKNDILDKLHIAQQHIRNLANSYSGGKILREGALVPIAGRPNAGKSSLLNALLEEERAIISHIPGTTRDTIEESFIHDGVVFRLVDTAGLRKTEDPIEMIGAERARKTLADADLILLVVDLVDIGDLSFEKEFLENYSHIPIIVVYNKVDLSSEIPTLNTQYFLSVSALLHKELTALTQLMTDLLHEHYQIGGNTVAITKQRHKYALQQALEALIRTEGALLEKLSNEFLVLDIREAISSLDDITGHTTSEDVLNNIFDHFCVGK